MTLQEPVTNVSRKDFGLAMFTTQCHCIGLSLKLGKLFSVKIVNNCSLEAH